MTNIFEWLQCHKNYQKMSTELPVNRAKLIAENEMKQSNVRTLLLGDWSGLTTEAGKRSKNSNEVNSNFSWCFCVIKHFAQGLALLLAQVVIGNYVALRQYACACEHSHLFFCGVLITNCANIRRIHLASMSVFAFLPVVFWKSVHVFLEKRIWRICRSRT